MKTKLLLASLCLGSILTAKAQTILYTNNFNGPIASLGMSIIDSDGDGQNWGVYSGDATTAAWGLDGNFIGSRSWMLINEVSTPLTPDNYIFPTNSILIPDNLATTALSFKVGANEPNFFQEHFAVYFVPGAAPTPTEIIDFCENNTAVYETTLVASNLRTAETKTIDVSSYAGQTVKIVIRHFNCTDKNLLYVDDLTLTQTTLATENFASSQFAVYPNPATNVIAIDAKQNGQISAVSFTDLNGRIVKQNNVQNLSKVELNISELSAGVYMMNVTSDKGTATKKIVKN